MAKMWEIFFDYNKHLKKSRQFKTADVLAGSFKAYLAWAAANPIDAKGVLVPRPITLTAFRVHAQIARDWYTFRKEYESKGDDFVIVLDLIEDIVKAQQIEQAMVGNYKENIVARANGLTDNVRTQMTGSVNVSKELTPQQAREYLAQLETEV